MYKSFVISFVGTVGSGKSTQIKLLVSRLKSNQFRVNSTFIKTGHIFAHFLDFFLVKLSVGTKKGVSSIRVLIENRPDLFKRLFKLWLTFDVLSISIRFILTVYIPLKLHAIVIVEEYFYAIITDYFYLAKELNLSPNTIFPAVRFMQRLLVISGSVHTIFLDAPNITLTYRWEKRLSLIEKSDYLEMQRTWLLSASKLSSSFLYVETSAKSVGKTHNLIFKHLKNIGL